ncbi:MAG: hypothetical protein ACYSWW_11210 [Planctomycetota bacterium]|jgi:hypothetical protein
MIDWITILDSAEDYQIHRLDSIERHLSELISIVDLPVQNWTDPFGRGYQYEFKVSEQEYVEDSLLVEISNVASVASVYYARRTSAVDGTFEDKCSDEPFDQKDLHLRENVVVYLTKMGYQIIPYAELNVIRRGKETYKWLINDTEEG